MRARQRIGAALAWMGARDGLTRVAAFVAVFAVLAAPIDVAAKALSGTDSGLLGHTGPGRIVVYALFLALAFIFHRTSSRRHQLGLRSAPGWRGVLARGWLFGIGGYLAYALLMRAGGAVEFRPPKSLADVAAAMPICALAGLGIATAEEILFRGFLLRTTAEALPRWPAVVLTGILFAFFHDLANPGDLLTEPADRMLFGGVFCLHLLLCASAIQTRALHLGIGIHAGLVFGEALFRRLRLFDVTNDDSWFLGLDGDPRRGFIAWGLFLASVVVIPRLMGKRALGAVADREPIAFAASGPARVTGALDRIGSIGPRGEVACWLAVVALAVAARLTLLLGIPLALVHDGSNSTLAAAASLPAHEPHGGWLLTGAIACLAPHGHALTPLIWIQHGATLLGLAAIFVALRTLLGHRATVPLAACAIGCAIHGMPIYLAHHVLPGAWQFALTSLAISTWALRLAGRGPAFAFGAALLASVQGFDAFLAWPLVGIIILRELVTPDPSHNRPIGPVLAIAGAAVPLAVAAWIAPACLGSYINPSPQIPAIFASIAHVDPELKRGPQSARDVLGPVLRKTPGMSRDERRRYFNTTVYRALRQLEPDAARRDALCLQLALAVVRERPLAASGAWLEQARTLLCGGSDNTDYPGESDLKRTARYTQKYTDGPGAEIHKRSSELLPRFEGRKPARAPDVLVWFLAILPQILTTTLLLVATAFNTTTTFRWLAIGCLSIWLPALLRFSLVDDFTGRDLAGLLPISMAALSASVVLAFRATAASLAGTARE